MFLKLSSLFYVFAFTFLLLPNSPVLGADPIKHFCSTNEYGNAVYVSNLNKLVTNLIYTAPDSGFSEQSSGEYPQLLIYGVALCKGNLRNQQCQTCLEEAGREILHRCPDNDEAIIWYDDCMLRYSVYGETDYSFYQCNPQNVTTRQLEFRKAWIKLEEFLTKRTPSLPDLYASYDVEIKGTRNQRIYGFSQCSRKLHPSDCNQCLLKLGGQLDHRCRGRAGGKYLTERCVMRYELHPFAHA